MKTGNSIKGLTHFFCIILLFFLNNAAFSFWKPPLLFIGSSTIYYWRDHLQTDFPDFTPINEGVLGGTYSYLLYRIPAYAKKYPYIKKIVVYAGDNDIALPFYSAENVANDFKKVVIHLHTAFPDAHIFIFSIKPCPAFLIRASTRTVKKTNDYFLKIINQLNAIARSKNEKNYLTFVNIFPKMLDAYGRPNAHLFVMPLGIHLNEKGYQIWTSALMMQLKLNL